MEFFEKLGIIGYPLLLCSIISFSIAVRQIAFVIQLCKTKAILQPDFEIPCEGFLKFIVSFTPMLGLLGTAIGITSAFNEIQYSTSAVTPSMISSGLYEALLTTIVGLSISMFSLFWLNIIEAVCKLFVRK